MKSKVFFFVCILLLHADLDAQHVFQISSLTRQGSGMVDMKKSFDEGIISLGYSYSGSADSSHIQLEKFDSNYVSQWVKSYSVISDTLMPGNFIETDAGDIIVSGQLITGGTSDINLFKTDQSGNLLWSRQIDHYNDDKPMSLATTGDGSIYIASIGYSLPTSKVISLIKCDSLGNSIWSKSISGGNNDIPSKMILSADTHLVIAGTSNSFSSGTSFFLSKFDSSGNYLWYKTYFTGLSDTCHSLIRTNDGGYLMVGSGGTDGNDVLIIKTDSTGMLQSSYSYNLGFGSNGNIDRGMHLINTADGGYAIAGETEANGSGLPFYFLLKLSSNFVIEWHNTFGFQSYNLLGAMLQMKDNGYLLCGLRKAFSSTTNKNILVKTDHLGQTACLQTIVDLTTGIENPFSASAGPSVLNTITSESNLLLVNINSSISRDTICYLITAIDETINNSLPDIYPNPFSDKLFLKLDNNSFGHSFEIRIFELSGRLIFYNSIIQSDQIQNLINTVRLEDGMYLLNIYENRQLIKSVKIFCQH